MYFSALRKCLQSLEEKRFYDIAIIYLSTQGFRDCSIIDGSGDGGRDVLCSWRDTRIQLSVRANWAAKINEEASVAANAGKHHFVYVTNRKIGPAEEQAFKTGIFKEKGNVDVSIHDLNRIATALSQPGTIRRAYEMMGMAPPSVLEASRREVAISSMLLFSVEAKALRENAVEAFVRAFLLKAQTSNKGQLISDVGRSMPGTFVDKAVSSAIDRLRSSGRILGTDAQLRLSTQEKTQMEAAHDEYCFARERDLSEIEQLSSLKRSDAEVLLDKSLRLLIRDRDMERKTSDEEDLRNFLSQKKLNCSRQALFECLAKTSCAKQFQFGKIVDEIFSTNTFDIYRALGSNTDITMILDASVALPLMIGLEFGLVNSRFSVAAEALRQVCRTHGIRMMVPSCYVNEMASHGQKALEFLEVHSHLPDEAKALLRGSKNAYLSHYTHIRETLLASGERLTLVEFLRHFGLRKDLGLKKIENRITSIIEDHGLTSGASGRFTPDHKKAIAIRKPFDANIIVEHDASVLTMITQNSDKGYILATWDHVMIDEVEQLSRVFADTPARVIDFLSLIQGADYDSDQSIELLSSLLYMDEQVAQTLANEVLKIKSTDQAFRLRRFVEAARQQNSPTWVLGADEMMKFLDEDSQGSPVEIQHYPGHGLLAEEI